MKNIRNIAKKLVQATINSFPGSDTFFSPPREIMTVGSRQWVEKHISDGHRIKKLSPAESFSISKPLWLPEDEAAFSGIIRTNYEVPELFVLELCNSVITSFAGLPILKKGLIPQDCVNIDQGTHDRLFARLHWKPVKSVAGTVAVIHSRYPFNYFHWLFDNLPRAIVHMLNAGCRPDFYYVSAKSAAQKYCLTKAGIDTERAIDPYVYPKVRADRIVVVSKTRTDGIINSYILDNYSRIFPSGQGSEKKRLYISRADAKWRYVKNESEVVRMLEAYGFASVRLSEFTIEEQISMFRNAECVVSAHGAGLSNTIWSYRPSVVVEIFSPDGFNDEYISLSGRLKKTHYCVLGEREQNLEQKSLYSDILVNPDKLEYIIRSELGFNTSD
jgi:hypothetical protein